MSRFRIAFMIHKRLCAIFQFNSHHSKNNNSRLLYSTCTAPNLDNSSNLDFSTTKGNVSTSVLEFIRSQAFSENSSRGQAALSLVVAKLLETDLNKAIEMIEYSSKHFSIRPSPEIFVKTLNALLKEGRWKDFINWFQTALDVHDFVANPRWSFILDEVSAKDDAYFHRTIDLAYTLTTASFSLSPNIIQVAQDCVNKFGSPKAFSVLFPIYDAEKNFCGLCKVLELNGWSAILEALSHVSILATPREAKLELIKWLMNRAPNWHSLVQLITYLKIDDFHNHKPSFLTLLLKRHLEASFEEKRLASLDAHYFQILLLIHQNFTPNWGEELMLLLEDMRQLKVQISYLGLDILFKFSQTIHLSMPNGLEKEDVLTRLEEAASSISPVGQDIQGNMAITGIAEPTECSQFFNTIESSPMALLHVLNVFNENRQYNKGVVFFRAKRHRLALIGEEYWQILCAPSYDLAIRMSCYSGDSVGAWRLIGELLEKRGAMEPTTSAAVIDMETSICGPAQTYPLALDFLEKQFRSDAPSVILGDSVLRVALSTGKLAVDQVLGLFEQCGVGYSIHTYRHLINAALRVNDVAQAYALLEKMSAFREPNTTIVLCRIIHHCLEFQHDMLPNLFWLAETQQLPSSRQLDFLRLRMYSEVAPLQLDKFIVSLDSMEHISPPTNAMYGKLLETVIDMKEYGLSLDIIRRMRLFGARPSETVYQILIERFQTSQINLEKICTMYSIDYPQANLDFLCRPET